MNEVDAFTIKMLNNLIANIEQKNITTVSRDGRPLSKNVAEVVFQFAGEPNTHLKRECNNVN